MKNLFPETIFEKPGVCHIPEYRLYTIITDKYPEYTPADSIGQLDLYIVREIEPRISYRIRQNDLLTDSYSRRATTVRMMIF